MFVKVFVDYGKLQKFLQNIEFNFMIYPYYMVWIKFRLHSRQEILYLGYESTLHLTIGEIAMEANEEEWLIEMKLKIDRTQQS